jgi:hypothetical protein
MARLSQWLKSGMGSRYLRSRFRSMILAPLMMGEMNQSSSGDNLKLQRNQSPVSRVRPAAVNRALQLRRLGITML